MSSAEEYVRVFTSSLLFPHIPYEWQQTLRNDNIPWTVRKDYIDRQLMPVLISTGLYSSIYRPTYGRGTPPKPKTLSLGNLLGMASATDKRLRGYAPVARMFPRSEPPPIFPPRYVAHPPPVVPPPPPLVRQPPPVMPPSVRPPSTRPPRYPKPAREFQIFDMSEREEMTEVEKREEEERGWKWKELGISMPHRPGTPRMSMYDTPSKLEIGMCERGVDCKDWSVSHREERGHPCRFGRECRYLYDPKHEGSRYHMARFTH